MNVFALALAAFVAERAHQWQALIASDWSFHAGGRNVARRAVLTTALVVGWGEGLGFYVQSQRAFWGMIFWVLTAHVALSGARWFRGCRPAVRRAGAAAFAVVAVVVMVAAGGGAGQAAPTWLGHSLLPAWTAPWPPVVLVAFVLGVHSIPAFVDNLRRVPVRARLRSAALAIGIASLEWWLVAKSIWFPPEVSFPDLVDWWDLGHGAHFLLHPVWMAPFLAHVVIDAMRTFGPTDPAA